MKFIPYDYQKYAINRIESQPKTALFMDLGLGKSVIALTAANDLINDQFEVRRCLIVAPLRVSQLTWPSEKDKWEHLKGLSMSLCLGDLKHREKALNARSDCVVINRENVLWLVKWLSAHKRDKEFDMIVVDESTSFKNHLSYRFFAMKELCRLADRVVIMTGTPIPNGYLDLWSQMYLLDQGARLGTSFSKFRNTFFVPDQQGWSQSAGHRIVYSWKPRDEAEKKISSLVSDISVSMSAEDYLKMPGLIINDVEVELSKDEKALYDKMERDFIIQDETADKVNEVVRADTAASLANKLLQLSGGEAYVVESVPIYSAEDDSCFKKPEPIHIMAVEKNETMVIHSRKIDALKEIVDDNSPKPVFVLYEYRHERLRILNELHDYHPRELLTSKDLDDWNSGKIQVLIGQPQSIGYGINLQAGGHILVWYSLTWNLELWEQAIGRLYRQGQKENVIVNCIIAKGTIDESVMEAIMRKKKVEDWMLDYVSKKKAR